MEILLPLLISTLAGLSTVVGGLITFINFKNQNKFITFCLSFSLSVMISLSVLELIPNSFIQLSTNYGAGRTLLISTFVFLLGLLSVNVINKRIKDSSNKSNLYNIGILSMLALMIHNLPEGIATFMSAYKDISLGISLGVAIMLHNIPEGISIAVPLYYATGSRGKGIALTFISGLAEPLGAILAYLLLKRFITDDLISLVLIYVGGLMITLSINKLLPEALSYKNKECLYYGLLTGLFLVMVNLTIF